MFEEKFGIKMPEDMKELYRYKNGSEWFYLLFPNDKCNREFKYRLLSLAEIEEEKNSFKIKTLCSQIFILTMRMILQKSCLNAWRTAE